MTSVRFVRSVLVLSLSCAPLFACGGDSDDEDTTMTTTEESRPETEGPEGCYIEANFRCDCDIEEAACTEDVGIWTDGCMSCAG